MLSVRCFAKFTLPYISLDFHGLVFSLCQVVLRAEDSVLFVKNKICDR